MSKIKNSYNNILHSIYSLFYFSSVRYSNFFLMLQNFFKYSDREEIMKTAMDFVAHSDLTGDYLEFGVFKGSTFIAAYNFAQKRKLELMRFYAFDSF